MTRALIGSVVAGAVAVAVALSAACERRSDHFCGGDPKIGCLCQIEPFRLRAGERKVVGCSAQQSLLRSRCCHDVDSNGETIICACESAICIESSATSCVCAMQDRLGEVGNVVSSCESRPANAVRCCKQAGRCICDDRNACAGWTAVDRCTVDDIISPSCPPAYSHEAKSCEALKWRRKG